MIKIYLFVINWLGFSEQVQTKANEAGVSFTIEDKPAERVASKVEAEQKNQLAEERVRTDLSKVSGELDQYIHTRDAVTKENEAREQQYQKDVKTEEERVRVEQARVEKENADKKQKMHSCHNPLRIMIKPIKMPSKLMKHN